MSFTTAEFIAMQARLSKSKPQTSAGVQKQTVREVGKGGIQDQIETWLKTQVPNCWWDRKRTDKKTTSRVGTPDFCGVYRGVAFALEIKRPGEKPTTEQLGELKWLELAGAKTKIVFSKDEAVEFLTALKPCPSTTP